MRVRVEEPCSRPRGKEHPRSREIDRRIACAHVTEVDHARERSVQDDNICRVKVAVQPYRRVLPVGSPKGLVPDVLHIPEDGGNAFGGDVLEYLSEVVRERFEGNAAIWTERCLGGRVHMERLEEARQSVGRAVVADRGGERHGETDRWQHRHRAPCRLNPGPGGAVGDGTDFPTAAHLASYAGLAPTTKSSGTSIHGEHAPRGGNRQLKRAMFLSAFACMNVDPASRTYYDKQRARGKTHTQALLRLVRQRTSVLFAMLRDGTFYEFRTPTVTLAA